MSRKKKKTNSKLRRTKNGTPVLIREKVSEGLYLVEDFKGGFTLVAEEDLK